MHMEMEFSKLAKTFTAALLRLRPDPRTRREAYRLWIDQICINQEDMAERSTQVTLMGQIFEQAQCTVVWLGEEDNDTQLVADFLDNHARRLHDWEWMVEVQTHRLTACGLAATQAIAFRPWFTRVWTFQEAAKAKKILLLCESHILQWNDLIRVCRDRMVFCTIEGSLFQEEKA